MALNSLEETHIVSIQDRIQRKVTADLLSVPVHCLIAPRQERCFRDTNPGFVKVLMDEIEKNQSSKFCVMACVVFKTNVDIANIGEGLEQLEVIGGNHSRIAMQRLADLHPENPNFQRCNVKLYRNLTRDECLHIGYIHNRMHNFVRKTTFVDLTTLFKKHLKQDANQDKPSKSAIRTWKHSLVEILGLEKEKGVQTLHNRYRTHIAVALESRSVWNLLTQIFVTHQEKVKAFHLKHLRDLSTETKIELLTQCVDKKINLIELHKQCRERAGKSSNDVDANDEEEDFTEALPDDVAVHSNNSNEQGNVHVINEITPESQLTMVDNRQLQFDQIKAELQEKCLKLETSEKKLREVNNIIAEMRDKYNKRKQELQQEKERRESVKKLLDEMARDATNAMENFIRTKRKLETSEAENLSLQKRAKTLEETKDKKIQDLSLELAELKNKLSDQTNKCVDYRDNACSPVVFEEREEDPVEGSLVILDWGINSVFIGKVLKGRKVISTKESLGACKPTLLQGEIPKGLLEFNKKDIQLADFDYCKEELPSDLYTATSSSITIHNKVNFLKTVLKYA